MIGWRRSEVFITNVVKCRPPGNRDPEPDEIAACAPWLRQQLEVLDPALVVTLGRFSMQTFLPGTRIGQAHGTMRTVDPATGARDALAYAMYHPAAAFRQQGLKETMKLDMLGIPDALGRARERRGPADDTTGATAGPLPGATLVTAGTSASGPGGPGDARVQALEPAAGLVGAGGDEVSDDRDQMGLFA
jgi:DNA polymerase